MFLMTLAMAPGSISAQNRTPCASCLIIGIGAGELDAAPPLPAGSLAGVQLLVPVDARVDRAEVAGAAIAVLVAPAGGTAQQVVFAARTAITELRAARPNVQVVIDGGAFTASGAALDELRPYVDAVIGEGWLRLQQASRPGVDELIAASLTPGAERLVLPVTDVDWRALQEFASRRPALVEVTGARRLTVGEILARYQAQQRRQDAIIKTTIARGTTMLLFEVPDFAAPITITAETTIFRGPEGTDIEERDIRVNGAAIAGGGAKSPPQLPLIDAERINTPPLTITLDEAYRYELEGEVRLKPDTAAASAASAATAAERLCYVVSFEPRAASRGLARGRAWIDARDFTLRRLQTIQKDLRGAIVSSEQVDEFGRVEAVGTTPLDSARGGLWLPVETRIFQSYEGAGFRTPIHRTITVRQYEVNGATFDTQLAAALASENVMMRDTPDGLRYLVRRRDGVERAAIARGGHSIRSIISGVVVDPNISRPLAFAGLSYLNLDLFGRGAQLNVFFGGVFGQVSWDVPSIAGTKWQAHGGAFGIAAQYTDRVFRNGREQYAENLLQQPGYVSGGLLRPLTPRVRATVDYVFDMTAFERTADTAPALEAPRSIVNHGEVFGLDADRGAWNVRAWWNPAIRLGWRPRDYQRYGARVRRTLPLGPSVSSRLELAWMGGHDLDRFSRYGFDSFDNPLHGYPTASIRYDRGAVLRSATAWTWRGLRVDGFGDAALVHDPGWASSARLYPGVGAGVESGAPFRTLVSFEWAYGVRAGTQTVRVTLYKPF